MTSNIIDPQKTKLLKFMISDTQYIQVTPEQVNLGFCKVCATCDLDYVDTEKNITIRFGNTEATAFYGGFYSDKMIKELINNERVIDRTIHPDLGFEWNQYFNGTIKKSDIFDKYYFVGQDHRLIRPYYNSWLYNEDGKIIFEITPFYPFHYETKKSHPDFITYKQFIKNYKSILKIAIPKETLLQWNEQAKPLKYLLKHLNH